MKHKRIILILAYFISLSLAGVSARFIDGGLELTFGISSLFMIVVSLVLFHSHLKKEWHRLWEQVSQMRFLSDVFRYYLMIYALNILLVPFINYLSGGAETTVNQEILSRLSTGPLIFIALFEAPLVEELVCRESILGGVNPNNKGMKIAMSICSMAIFILLHVTIWYEILTYLPLAFVLVVFYWRYKQNIWAPICLHLLNNMIAVVLMIVFSIY